MTVVVGGSSRKIGKSSVVAGIIRTFRTLEWTSIKITSHWHDDLAEGNVHIHEETVAGSNDSGRYLAAGARRSIWIATEPDSLESAMPRLRAILLESPHAIIESNSVLDHLRPDLFLMVVDPAVAECKETARKHLCRADAFISVNPESPGAGGVDLPAATPRFPVTPPEYMSAALTEYIGQRIQSVTTRPGKRQ